MSVTLWLLPLIALALLLYFVLFRPWQLRWGATDEEVSRPLPGDELVIQPHFVATRAVTVNAPSDTIWPWLMQIGCTRAGWYSYDWIDNQGRPSANQIITELQDMKVGDLVPMTPDANLGFRVVMMEPGELLWATDDGRTTWFWGLVPLHDGQTRLVTRVRVQYDFSSLLKAISYLMIDVGDFFMMRKCMLGIKARAEGQARLPERG